MLRTLAILLIFPSLALPQPKTPVPRLKPEQTPGYTPTVIEGFTVLLSKETLAHKDDPAYEKKPLDVLEGEFKTIAKIFPAKTLAAVRGLLIWVEWDEQIVVGNGRAGQALAVYYGGHQASLIGKGKHPLQARTVTIHRLKALTEEHQPKRDSGRCVLLHEIAHAVHDQVLNRENPGIKSAYKQALERRLIDPNAYASTNEMEFFAEMTCAYFDQLNYYPRNRSELRKHDAVTFKLMETIWGQRKITDSTASKSTSVDAPPLDRVDLGERVSGPRVGVEELKGHPSLIIYWNAINVSSFTGLTKAAGWDADLADFGLKTVAVHLTGTKPVDVKGVATGRGWTFAVSEGKWTQLSLIKDFKDFPQALVYTAEGDCVFRGSLFDAETHVRSAVGIALLDDLDGEVPKSLASIVEAIQKGKSPAGQFSYLSTWAKSKDRDVSEAAKNILARLTESGQKHLERAEKQIKDEPLEAFFTLERLPTTFKDTPIATRSIELLGIVKQNKLVATEIKARGTLAAVKKIETDLNGRPGSFDPNQPAFRRDNAALLRQLEAAVVLMKRTFPATRATEQGVRIAEKFGINVP